MKVFHELEGDTSRMTQDDKEKISELLPIFKEKEVIFGHTVNYSYKGYDGYYIILNFSIKKDKISHGTIAHEVIHCANMILNNRGILSDYDNDEPLTYLATWISNEVYKFINKHDFKPTFV